MGDSDPAEVTVLLQAWANGDPAALDRLTPQVYQELRRIAGACMRGERPGASMQATALVHEAYLKLIDQKEAGNWQHRAHFFAVASRIMRHILLDAARRRCAAKRGGPVAKIVLDEIPDFRGRDDRELIRIDDALKALEEFDSRKARMVELRFFGGLSVEETATVLKVSVQTVHRDWKLARAWLLSELKKP
jgi:RNA polymerase sigma-70 factor (ECF subfamily)